MVLRVVLMLCCCCFCCCRCCGAAAALQLPLLLLLWAPLSFVGPQCLVVFPFADGGWLWSVHVGLYACGRRLPPPGGVLSPVQANQVAVLESTAETQSKVIEKLQQLLSQRVIGPGGGGGGGDATAAPPGTEARPKSRPAGKWDVASLLDKVKGFKMRERFITVVQEALRAAKEHDPNLNTEE